MIHEIGIYLNGVLLTNRTYYNSTTLKTDRDLICALISAVEVFYKTTFSQELEYLKGKHHILVYSKKIIKNIDTNESFHVVAYAIVNNRNSSLESYVGNKIRPKLEELLNTFEINYGKYIVEPLNKIPGFSREIDEIFAESWELQSEI